MDGGTGRTTTGALMVDATQPPPMQVTVEVPGDDPRTVSLDDGATYGDAIAAVGLSRHEATALVDGQPVPADAAIGVDDGSLTVLKLVQGG